ncbi:MAG: hypothetical protein LH480_14250 [Rubrivivax sp.]|nr:hypothetical protein [Rubrivivax sp.]
MKDVNGSRVAALAILARCSMSSRPMMDTSAVALTITSQLLAKPGMAWRTICGSTMRRST